MDFRVTVDDVSVNIDFYSIKEAVENFDTETRNKLIAHLQKCNEEYPDNSKCDDYETTVDEVEVLVELSKDDLLSEFGDDIEEFVTEGKIIVDAPTLAIQLELQEVLEQLFKKHGLNAANHVYGDD